MIKIAIIDYGMGNLKSVHNAFRKVGADPIITRSEKEISEAHGLVLPGVGAFPKAIRNIESLGIDRVIKKEINKRNKPLLGICLGMQLLSTKSYEGGEHKGLSLIEGTVKKIPTRDSLRLPHIGWNDIINKDNCPLFENIDTGKSFYFVHSYFFDTNEKYISLKVNYGGYITAAIQKDNIFGVQFHPERSQTSGLRCISNYVKLISKIKKC